MIGDLAKQLVRSFLLSYRDVVAFEVKCYLECCSSLAWLGTCIVIEKSLQVEC